jgi:hypothetical protein
MVPWPMLGGYASEDSSLGKGSQPTCETSSRSCNRGSTLSSDPSISEYQGPDQYPEHVGSGLGPQLTTSGSSHWDGLKRIIRAKKKSPGTLPDAPPRTPLHRLLQLGGEVSIALSADCERLITWTNKSLGLYEICSQGEIREWMVTSLPEGDHPYMVLASVTYCVIVYRGPNNDKVDS